MSTLDKNRSILAAVTFSLAAIAGCAADAASSSANTENTPGAGSPERPDDSRDDSRSIPPAPQAPTADAGAPPPPTSDAGTTSPRSLPLQCTFSAPASGPALFCLETAEGKAGDVVELEVHIMGTPACSDANQLYGRIRLDPNLFELVNVASHVDCTSRDAIEDDANPGMQLITWQKFGGGAIAGCDDTIEAGKVDTIQIRIKPGTPPGDYNFAWDTSEFWGTDPACETMGNHFSSKVRVLP